ncbi:MAG: electron transport complex subunit RsxC [Eubacteriales bacterium]|nr:electron transport complex subunit RsxC [Eubacteriales bacterium]
MHSLSTLIRNVVPFARNSQGGVHVAYKKSTHDMPVVSMPAPKKVIIPLRQHIGAPCVAVVKKGDYVAVGQMIADCQGLGAPIHSSVSGKVKKIADYPTTQGMHTPAIEIESDGLMTPYEGLTPPNLEGRENFLAAVRQSGLVGCGGAGFPTHVKLNVPSDKEIKYLVVNAAECEPYISVDNRQMIDGSEDVFYGLVKVAKFLEIDTVVIGIEDNKPLAIETMQAGCDKYSKDGLNIRIHALPSCYPQGAEKVIINSALDLAIPPGKLPADVGCVVMNVTSLAVLGKFFKTGMPLVSRNLTVDGSAICNPKNVCAPLGVSLKEIIDFCGGFKEEPKKILMGGPMMGIALDNIDQPVLKYNNALLCFSEEDRNENFGDEYPCIRCGRCVTVCPMKLMPTSIKRFASVENTDQLKISGVMVCMECGSCAYACPSNIPLVQYMRLGKSILRKEAAKK